MAPGPGLRGREMEAGWEGGPGLRLAVARDQGDRWLRKGSLSP